MSTVRRKKPVTLLRRPADLVSFYKDDAPEKGRSSVYKRLTQSPGSFAFPEAIALVRGYLKQMGVEKPDSAIRFKVNPNLSFPPSDIDSIEFKETEKGVQAVMTMNLLGLHGAGSPLPAYFTEYVAQNQDESDPLREFLDLFNHRLVSLLYGSWEKYRYHVQYEQGAADKLSSRFFSFIGMGYAELKDAKQLNWSKLLAYTGLIAFKSDAAGSLESILRHYFSHEHVYVVPCIRRMVAIPEDQQSRLGLANSRLGVDMLLGSHVPDQTGKFRIRITNLTWERFNSFLPDTTIFKELTVLVKTVLRSRLQFDVELRLLPEEVRPMRIGRESETRLGWSTWGGENGDGIVVLYPSVQET